MIYSTSNVWAESGAKGKVVGYGDCCLAIKPAMAKSVNSAYVVFTIMVSRPRDYVKTSLEIIVIPSSP